MIWFGSTVDEDADAWSADPHGAERGRAAGAGATRAAAAGGLYAIAHVLDGVSRAEAARLCVMDRQALRDAVVRFNAEGIAGLVDRPRSGSPPRVMS